MLARVDGVAALAPTADLRAVHAYRNDLVPAVQTGSLSVRACDARLLSTLDAELAGGAFLNAATAEQPVAVLGDEAAARPGENAERIWLSGHWFTVTGVLRPTPLTPEIDRSVLVGFPVGGIGVANVMVVGVLERRTEIGLRRALGARRRHVATQFLAEAVVLGALGGAAGLAIGTAITMLTASTRGWTPTVPPPALWGGLTAALAVGALAGLYPATRAARLAPTDALRAR
jgi:hypothetical protein